ncbi:hypothetical protein NYE67_16405 [Solibacillus sp. FSL W8-0474]|uniref:hypothetical protein n=1 Tax=Solibacillus sp. FSL W8-0474 TaxID=2975336 RepID=UPI0030F5276F
MKKDTVKRMTYMIIGSLIGLAIASFFNNGNESFLSRDNVLTVILIVVVGGLIGSIGRGWLDKVNHRSSDE